MPAELTPKSRWTLVTRHLGWEVRVFDELDSTNSHALTLADNPNLHGLVILARSQTAGRGQYGRTWTAPTGTSVLASVLLFPPPALRRPVVMTAWAAVAVCDIINELAGLDATIKWPNDIFVQPKKVAGFLIEQKTTGKPDTPLATVVGLGLNVTQPNEVFTADHLSDAGSLASLSGKTFAVDNVARAIIHRMDDEYERLLSGDLSTLESQWQWRFGLAGKPVIAELADGSRRGRLIDLAFDGVTLRDDAGVVKLAPETVRHLVLDREVKE